MQIRRSRTASTATGRMLPARAGSMMPAMLMGFIAVLCAVALVLNELWLESAQTELQTAAESAALASGGCLASDELLKEEPDFGSLLDQARDKGSEIAGTNKIGGQPVEIDSTEGSDIRFGHLVDQERSGRTVFVETSKEPKSVVVRAEHSRSRNNPVGLFLAGLTGTNSADVAVTAEATIDNRIAGFQALNGIPIPALPLAILKSDTEQRRLEAWDVAIEQRKGVDRFCYHEDTGEIIDGPDGIPEITLRSAAFRGEPKDANVHLFAIQNGFTREDVIRQIQTGWLESDVPSDDGIIRTDRGAHDLDTLNGIAGPYPAELRQIIGQCRIVFLYDRFETRSRSAAGRLRCVGAVAGRILSIDVLKDGQTEIAFQPGVLTTRTALLAVDTVVQQPWEQLANRYIYKLQLTQ